MGEKAAGVEIGVGFKIENRTLCLTRRREKIRVEKSLVQMEKSGNMGTNFISSLYKCNARAVLCVFLYQ